MYIKKTFMLLFTILFLSTSCTPGTRQQAPVGSAQEYRTIYGVVRSMTPVKIDSQLSKGVGVVIGAVLGGILGSTIGGGTGKVLSTAVGAVGGGAAGGFAGKKTSEHNAYEIMIQSDDGRTFSIVEHESVNIAIGQRVRLLLGDTNSRVEAL